MLAATAAVEDKGARCDVPPAMAATELVDGSSPEPALPDRDHPAVVATNDQEEAAALAGLLAVVTTENPPAALRPGDRLELTGAPDRLRLFRADTGQAIPM